LLIGLVVTYGVVGLGVLGAGRHAAFLRGRRAFVAAMLAPLLALAVLVRHLGAILDGEPVEQTVSWVPALGLDVALRLDAFGAVMVLAVAAVGIAVLAYSYWYFAAAPGHPERDDLHRIAGLLTLFAGAMLGIVCADHLIVLFTAWELTSITSYLLIGIDHRKATARAAALHALLITSAGGLVLLAGLVLVGQAAGTYRWSEIVAHPPSGPTVTAGVVCIAVGAFTKSAQYPFHSWLPGAMAAPTPISAYLHSATMVKAGVFLVARVAPVFAGVVGVWRPLVIVVGLVTMVAGGLRALRQVDLKLLLAHGTVSQLGLMMVLMGAGTGEATAAGVTVLVAHVLFKAALFMVVGVVDHQAGTRDLRSLPELGRGWTGVKVIAVVSAASMAGIPALAGFVAKEAAYTSYDHATFAGHEVVLAAMVVGSMLTVAYSARFVDAVLRRSPGAAGKEPAPAPAVGFVAPAALLAMVTLAFGLVPRLEDHLVAAATVALDPLAHPPHLGLWHGLNLPLLLTGVTFAGGALLYLGRRRVARVLSIGDALPHGTEIYLALLQGLNRVANRVTAIVQNGTLSIYTGVVLVTAAVLPGAVLIARADWPGWPAVIGSGTQIPVAIALVGSALMAAVVRRRFTAVLFLSAAGYSMAALFVVQGAPDLALTQAAIETLSTVLFVLVLRKLPDRFERRSSPFTRSLRVTISVGVAVMVFAFAIIARGSRTAPPVSRDIVERALPEAKGRNVVNTILVDFRGFDTMGEVTVLAAAAIGCVALARVGRRGHRSKEDA